MLKGLSIAIAALALLAAGCGSSDKGKLTAKQARTLSSRLDAAERSANAQRCNEARGRAEDGRDRAERLPKRVDADIRDNLVAGFEHLIDRIDADCETKPEPEKTPTSTPTETATAEATPTETATAEATETPSPTATATATAEATPTSTADSGGVQSPEETP